jgi:hypothetical protein
MKCLSLKAKRSPSRLVARLRWDPPPQQREWAATQGRVRGAMTMGRHTEAMEWDRLPLPRARVSTQGLEPVAMMMGQEMIHWKSLRQHPSGDPLGNKVQGSKVADGTLLGWEVVTGKVTL